MHKVLVIGAGMVVRPFIHYLFEESDFHVKVASLAVSEPIEKLIAGHPRGEFQFLDVKDTQALRTLIFDTEVKIVASFVPPVYETKIVRMCIEAKKSMVATSYASKEMQSLDKEAKEAGVLILTEIGLDPGIDHMTAMSCINKIQKEGGEVVSFCSNCGAIPAPEASMNPFGYKFSWHPRGALEAAKRPAKYLKDGKEVTIASDRIFENYSLKFIENLGWFESYPNMDCLPYIHFYGIPSAGTIYRGTLRYVGWSETINKFLELGLLDENVRNDLGRYSYREFLGELIESTGDNNLEKNLSVCLQVDKNSAIMKRLEWLGFLSDEPLPSRQNSAFGILLARVQEKLRYEDNERDMVVLQDEIIAHYPEERPNKKITSTLIDYGVRGGDSSIARTVSLPSVIATKLILQEKISLKGVHIPVDPVIYGSVLEELKKQGIILQEKQETL